MNGMLEPVLHGRCLRPVTLSDAPGTEPSPGASRLRAGQTCNVYEGPQPGFVKVLGATHGGLLRLNCCRPPVAQSIQPEGYAPRDAVRLPCPKSRDLNLFETCRVNHNTVKHTPTAAPLFGADGRVRPQDVKQRPKIPGRLWFYSDCALLAAAQAVAHRCPTHVHELFSETREHSVTVRYYDVDAGNRQEQNAADAKQITLPRSLLEVDGEKVRLGALGEGAAEPSWPAFLEKAYAATHGGYDALCRYNNPKQALEWLTGVRATTRKRTLWQRCSVRGRRLTVMGLAGLYKQGHCVVVHFATHALALVGVEQTETGVRLRRVFQRPKCEMRRKVTDTREENVLVVGMSPAYNRPPTHVRRIDRLKM